MSFGTLFGTKEKSSEVHKSLAACLTIRQIELRLGRQQISSLENGVFETSLLTRRWIPRMRLNVERSSLWEKAKSEMIEEGVGVTNA